MGWFEMLKGDRKDDGGSLLMAGSLLCLWALR